MKVEQNKQEERTRTTVHHNGTEGTNEYTRVGILIEEETTATFTRMNDRIR